MQLCVVMVMCLLKHRDSFTFLVLNIVLNNTVFLIQVLDTGLSQVKIPVELWFGIGPHMKETTDTGPIN
jgi:hypothetical protein